MRCPAGGVLLRAGSCAGLASMVAITSMVAIGMGVNRSRRWLGCASTMVACAYSEL